MSESDLYNYADDNTLSFKSKNPDTLVKTLENDSLKLIKWFNENHMKATPEKFQAIAFGRKTHNLQISFNLDGVNIKCDEEVKLLGVTFDFMLNFNTHIANICRKTARQLNVMKRIGRNINKLGRLTMYYSLIMSNLNYCPLTWHFTGETNTKKIEKLQERALRFIYDDNSMSYHDLLLVSGLPSLKVRRMRSVALETFKIFNKEGPSYLHDLVRFKDSKYNFRYTNCVEIPRPRTERYGRNSFRYSAASMWNSLPDTFRLCSSYTQFKSLIDQWNGLDCSCSACAR